MKFHWTSEQDPICSLNCKLRCGDPINASLKDHVLGVAPSDWEYRDLLQELHIWAEIFVTEFQLGLEIPVFRVEPISIKRMGTYCPGRNGFGLEHEITLNSRYLKAGLGPILFT